MKKKINIDIVSVLITLVFVLGFFVLNNYTGFTVVDYVAEDNNLNDVDFWSEDLWLGTTDGERFWYNSGYPYANKSFRITEFINVSGDNFTLAGEEYTFIGTDSYYIVDYATNHTYDDDGNEINNSRQYATELLNEMQYLNINVFRTWVGIQCGGRSGSNSSTWQMNESGGHFNCFENDVPGNFNETMFEALDWVIYEASKRDIRVMPVFINNWKEYGGMRWYVHHSSTTDKTNENVTDDTNAKFDQFHDQFYNDTQSMVWFQNFTNYTLHRNNTYSGIQYKDDPAIFGWLLANEPRAKTDAGRTLDLVRNWTINMTRFINKYDKAHLIGLGIEGWGYNETWGEGTNFIDNHNGTGVNFTTFALHPDQWEYFLIKGEGATNGYWMNETFNETSIDWWTNGTGLSWNNKDHPAVTDYSPDLGRHGYQDWVRQHVNWSLQLGMPIILQELGVETDHNITLKNRFYNQTMDNFYNSGGDGMLLWTLNHDEYYYSTATNGTMDDGFGFYLSDDTFLKNKSLSPVAAFSRAMDQEFIVALNNFKYDFILNTELAGIHNLSKKGDYAVGNWWFEKNATNYANPTVKNGTFVGNPQNTTGVVGYAYDFDSCGDYIDVGDDDSLEGMSNITMSLWVKPESTGPSNGRIIDKVYNQVYALYYNHPDLGIALVTDADSIADATCGDLTANVWNYIAMTWSNATGTYECYINSIASGEGGTLDGTNISTNDISMKIGGRTSGLCSENFNGSIDEVIIFNRTLTSGEISQIYNDSVKTQPGIAKLTNCTINLNVYNDSSWSGYYIAETNSTTVAEDTDFTFTNQFSSGDEQFKWFTQCCDSYDMCLNSSVGSLTLLTAPVVTLISPNKYVRLPEGGTIEFNYNVTDTLDVGNCQLYVDNVLNKTDYTVTRDITQTFTVNSFSNISYLYTWRVECTDVGDNIDVSENRTFRGGSTFSTQSSPNIGAHAFVDENYVVGSWRFEDDIRDGVFDETGLNNGTISGGVKWCPDNGDSQKWNCSGRIGKGVSFDGDDDKITMVDDVSLEPQISTFSIWFYSKSWKNYISLIRKTAAADGYFFFVSSTGALSIDYGGNDERWNTGQTLPLGQWTHLVYSNDGNNGLLWIDGEYIDSTAVGDSSDIASTADLLVGNNELDSYGFNGTLDEFTIWNRSLSNEEVKQLYYSSAVSYNSTFTIQDISASNNNTQDEDNDTIKFIYDWYVNNESMAVLNMPFEAVNNGSEMNFSKDYSDNENHGKTNFNSDVFGCEGSGSTRSCSGWNRTGGYDGFGAYEFDGVDDFITVSDSASLDIDSKITISFWTKVNTLPAGTDGMTFIGKWGLGGTNRAYVVYLLDSGSKDLQFSIEQSDDTDKTIDSNEVLSVDTWYHIVSVADGSYLRIYVNGIEKGTAVAYDGTIRTMNNDLLIGKLRPEDSTWVELNGTIDEVMIFNRSLSAEQIKALYYNQTQTIKSSETVKGQSWKAEVTANDGYGDSIEYNTSEIIIVGDIDVIVSNVFPTDAYNYPNDLFENINFTYNVTDGGAIAGISNCSLYNGTTSGNLFLYKTDDTIDSDGSNQTFNYVNFTEQTQTIYWLVSCYDKNSNQTNSTEFSLELKKTVVAEEEEEVVGGGSSSGAGSSGARQASTITEQRQIVMGNVYTIDKLTPGETELILSDPTLSIVAIYLDSSKEAENVELKIEETRNVQIEKPDRRVYRYVNLETNMPESFFNKIRIIFKLHKGYGEDIKLLRYTSSWLALETKKIDSEYAAEHNNLPNIEFDNEYYDYYEAVSPGFSYFAITSKKISAVLKEEIERIAQEVIEKPNKKEIWVYAGIPILILAGVSLVLLYFMYKLFKKNKKITYEIILLGAGVVVLLIPFTDEILYWAILPLSVIVLILGGVGFLVWKYRKKLKKIL